MRAQRHAAFVRNGYRSAKSHGKPNLAIARQAQQIGAFSEFRRRLRGQRVYIPFIAILKLPFQI
jgi:hypothetical protein